MPGNEPVGSAVPARERVVRVAADLMHGKGIGATSVGEVARAAGVTGRELRRYFADKEKLVEAVVDLQIHRVLAANEPHFRQLWSLRELEAWGDMVVSANYAGGCPLGRLLGELTEEYEHARKALVSGFAEWESQLADGLARMRASGGLGPRADPAELATGIMAALRGGLLLAQTTRDARQLETALDMAIAHVRAYATGD